jgi:hypothetical protein
VKTLARNGSRPVQNSPVNLVLVAEVDEQSRAFDAMKLMFEIRHADTDLHIQKHRKGDAKFWAMVEPSACASVSRKFTLRSVRSSARQR